MHEWNSLNHEFFQIQKIIKEYEKKKLYSLVSEFIIKTTDIELQVYNKNKFELIFNSEIKKTFDSIEKTINFLIELLIKKRGKMFKTENKIVRNVSFERSLFIAKTIPIIEYFYNEETKQLCFKHFKGVVIYIVKNIDKENLMAFEKKIKKRIKHEFI